MRNPGLGLRGAGVKWSIPRRVLAVHWGRQPCCIVGSPGSGVNPNEDGTGGLQVAVSVGKSSRYRIQNPGLRGTAL